MQKTVVVIGATGLVGSALVQELTDDPQVAEIRILSRRALSYASDKIKGLQSGKIQDYAYGFVLGAVILVMIMIYNFM